jgi:hypothetical protein
MYHSNVRAADAPDRSPVGKVFFAEVTGDDVYVHLGNRSQPVNAKETYAAEGLGIDAQGDSAASMVFSNGLAVQLIVGSKVEVKRFAQEPFRPNRTDLALEPSISVVALDLVRGTAVFATSKLAAGSLFTVFTPTASITIQGGTLIVTADGEHTHVSLLSGTCVLYGRSDSTRVAVVQAGQAGDVHRVAEEQGLSVSIDVTPLTAIQLETVKTDSWLVLRAKQTVYFEEKSVVAAFNSATNLAIQELTNGSSAARPAFELVPVRTSPQDLPLEYTTSPAALLATTRH